MERHAPNPHCALEGTKKDDPKGWSFLSFVPSVESNDLQRMGLVVYHDGLGRHDANKKPPTLLGGFSKADHFTPVSVPIGKPLTMKTDDTRALCAPVDQIHAHISTPGTGDQVPSKEAVKKTQLQWNLEISPTALRKIRRKYPLKVLLTLMGLADKETREIQIAIRRISSEASLPLTEVDPSLAYLVAGGYVEIVAEADEERKIARRYRVAAKCFYATREGAL